MNSSDPQWEEVEGEILSCRGQVLRYEKDVTKYQKQLEELESVRGKDEGLCLCWVGYVVMSVCMHDSTKST